MKNEFMSFPFNIPSSIFRQIVAQTPGIYQISNPWNWGGISLRTTIVTPTRIALDMDGEGLVAEETVSFDLDDSASWDIGLGTDYTVAANRQGLWFYIHTYSDSGVIKYLLSDIPDTLNTAVLKWRAIERFFCYASGGVNHVGDVVGGVLLGDVDIISFQSLTGASVTILSGEELPSVFVPETFFYNTLTSSLHFSMGSEWITISEASKINDFDFAVGSVFSFMGDSAPTGYIPLTDTNQIVLIEDYQKVYANIGIKYGGDGITTFALPTIAQASGDEKIIDWTLQADWSSVAINIFHELGVNLPKLKVELFMSPTGNDSDSWKVENTNNFAGSNTYGGVNFDNVDVDNITLQTSFNGVSYNDGTATTPTIISSYYYKVVITKDSPLPADVTLCMYMGSGGLSEAVDGDLDSRITTIENTLALSVPPHKTPWINRSDWTNVHMGDNTTKNVDSNVNHGFGVGLDDLDIQVLISTDGTDSNSFEIYKSSNAAVNTGINLNYIDDNNIEVQTGTGGLLYTTTSGASAQITTLDWYYKIIVRSHNSLSFIDARNAFINHKDWVEWASIPSSTAQTFNKYAPDGLYKVTVQADNKANSNTVLIDINRVKYPAAVNYYGSWSTGAAMTYVVSTDTWDTLDASHAITRIERWESVTGESKDAVKVSDGYETLWEDLTATAASKVFPVEDGKYRVSFKLNTGLTMYSADITIDTAGLPAATSFDGALTQSHRANYLPGSSTWTSSDTAIDVIKIEKQIGYIALDVTHTREHISGTAHIFAENLDTTSGDLSLTPHYPVAPIAGDTFRVTNIGVGGNVITDLPDGLNLPDALNSDGANSIDFSWNHSDQIWFVDNSALYGRLVAGKDWVELWKDYTNVSITKTLQVEDGIYRVQHTNGVGGTTNYTSMVIVNTEDNPTAANFHSANWDYNASYRVIYTPSTGVWTTNRANFPIAKIERFQDTAGADRPSLPIDNGWELYEDLSGNTDQSITRFLPVGKYKFIVGIDANTIHYSTPVVEIIDGIVDYRSVWSPLEQILYSTSTGALNTGNASYAIKKIEVWKGTMHMDIYNTRSHTTGTPNMYIEEYDTTSADFDFTARLAEINALGPQTGDYITLYNSGTDDTKYIENAPDSGFVASGQTIDYFYSSVQGAWKQKGNEIAKSIAKVIWTGGGTPVISKQYNTALIERLAIGRFRLHFEHQMPDVNYGISGHGYDSVAGAFHLSSDPSDTQTVDYIDFSFLNYLGNFYDPERAQINVF